MKEYWTPPGIKHRGPWCCTNPSQHPSSKPYYRTRSTPSRHHPSQPFQIYIYRTSYTWNLTQHGNHRHETWLRMFPSGHHTGHFQIAPRYPFYKASLPMTHPDFCILLGSKSCVKPQSPFPTPSNTAPVPDFTCNNWSLKDKKWQRLVLGCKVWEWRKLTPTLFSIPVNNVITGEGEEEGRRAEPYISCQMGFNLFFFF